MTTVSQFLGNRLLEALRNHQRPLLVNGCIDTYSRSKIVIVRQRNKPNCWTWCLLFSWRRAILRARQSTDSKETVSHETSKEEVRGQN
jgi:hypothetical protein